MPDYEWIILTVPDETEAAGKDVLPWFVESCQLAKALHPQAKIGLTFNGYDEDPREVYDIPRIVEFCRRIIETTAFAQLHPHFGSEPGTPMGSANVWAIAKQLFNSRTGCAEFPHSEYTAAVEKSRGKACSTSN